MTGIIPSDRVGLWNYPEQRRVGHDSFTPKQAALYESLTTTFSVPHPITIQLPQDQNLSEGWTPEIQVGPGLGLHRQARVDQILYRPQKAIPLYLKIQSYRALPPSPKDAPAIPRQLEPVIARHLPNDIRIKHLRAAEEALFWRAACQFQKQAYESAAKAFEVYLRQVATKSYEGRFKSEANYLAGLSLGLAGNYSRGTAFLRNVPPGHSRFHAARYLIQLWTREPDNNNNNNN